MLKRESGVQGQSEIKTARRCRNVFFFQRLEFVASYYNCSLKCQLCPAVSLILRREANKAEGGRRRTFQGQERISKVLNGTRSLVFFSARPKSIRLYTLGLYQS